MPEFRNRYTDVVMSVPEGRQLGPDWEPVTSAPSPAKKRPAKKTTSKATNEDTTTSDG